MSSYGGNLTLKHVQQVFPKKSRGEQADIHEEFGESTSNAEELKAAYIKKHGSLRESVKLTRETLRSLIKEELTRLVEDPHGGGHTVGNGPIFTGAGPGAHPLRGFYEDDLSEEEEDEDLAEARLLEGAAKPPEIEMYLKGHGLVAGIDYDFGGDGVTQDYYIIGLRNNAEDLASMLDRDLYMDSPVTSDRIRAHRDEVHWT